MSVRIAHPPGLENVHVIEQAAVAARRCLQPIHVVREQLRVKGANLGQLGEIIRVALMMRNRMLRIRHACLWVRSRADRAPS